MDAKGVINPCCKFINDGVFKMPSLYELDTLNGIHDLDIYKRVRQDIEKSNKPSSCINCWKLEDNNLESKRQKTNKIYLPHDIRYGYVQDMEVALDYTCNMMCRICGPHSSSKWGAAKNVIDVMRSIGADNVNHQRSATEYQKAFRRVMENTDLSYARVIKLQGGETFYSKNLEWFIDKLYNEVKEPNKLHLDIFTNCSIFPNDTILEKILHFKNPIITASIDGVGELADVTRWGVDWKTVSEVCKKWSDVRDKHFNLDLRVNCTVSLLNVNKLQEVLEFFRPLNFKLTLNRLHNPNYLSVNMVPKQTRAKWLLNANDSKYSHTIKDHNAHLLSDIVTENNFKLFLETTKILDQYQNNCFELVNKEIYDLANQMV